MDKEQVGKGSILGALVGDAAGATLEFLPRTPDRSQVKHAMTMTGGGYLRTAPGQITDDGEMALCLMHALAGEDSFSIERVAQSYLQWYQSMPFDIGRTTRNGLAGGLHQHRGTVHQGMWREAEQHNRRSKANGGLMRICPLGVWGHRLCEDELVEAVCQDNRLTHPNPACQHSSAVSCVAIRHLMLHPQDSDGAFKTAAEWAKRLANSEVQEWLGLAEDNEDVGYTPSIGFVKYGFVHAFRHLKNKTNYMNAIFETLIGGGDTDTNACIVGGLVGAYHGEQGIPAPLRKAILNCDTRKGRRRPEFLQTRVHLPALLERIVD
jgi:ADP-ribosyl-[dinitrogen reductase] hydrolase